MSHSTSPSAPSAPSAYPPHYLHHVPNQPAQLLYPSGPPTLDNPQFYNGFTYSPQAANHATADFLQQQQQPRFSYEQQTPINAGPNRQSYNTVVQPELCSNQPLYPSTTQSREHPHQARYNSSSCTSADRVNEPMTQNVKSYKLTQADITKEKIDIEGVVSTLSEKIGFISRKDIKAFLQKLIALDEPQKTHIRASVGIRSIENCTDSEKVDVVRVALNLWKSDPSRKLSHLSEALAVLPDKTFDSLSILAPYIVHPHTEKLKNTQLEVLTLQQELSSKENQLVEQNREIKTLKESLKDMEYRLNNKDAVIEDLTTRMSNTRLNNDPAGSPTRTSEKQQSLKPNKPINASYDEMLTLMSPPPVPQPRVETVINVSVGNVSQSSAQQQTQGSVNSEPKNSALLDSEIIKFSSLNQQNCLSTQLLDITRQLDVNHGWELLGMKLGLKSSKLHEIKTQRQFNSYELHMLDVISSWLSSLNDQSLEKFCCVVSETFEVSIIKVKRMAIVNRK